MELQELKQRIKDNNIPSFLVFTGDEYVIQRMYIDKIAEVKHLTLKYIDSVADVIAGMGATSLFSTNYLYVVMEDRELITNEKLQAEVQARLKSSMLILKLVGVDKRLKFYKTYKDSIIEFNGLKSEIMKRYIQKEIELSDKNCDKLIEVCEGNYSRCLLEIDKIRRYADGNPTLVRNIYNNSFETLLEDGTIYQPPKDAIFDFVKAVLQNKSEKAYNLLQNCYDIGESKLAILSVLFNNTKQVLQVQTCEGKDTEKITGLTYWQIKNAKECAGYYSNNNLIYIMRLIQSVERKIKIGEMEEAIAVEYVVSNIL